MASIILRRSVSTLSLRLQHSSRRLPVLCARRASSSAAGGAGGNTLLFAGLGLTVLGGVVVYRQLRKPPTTLGDLKREGYKKTTTPHPEAEAEAQASSTGPPATTSTTPTDQKDTPTDQTTEATKSKDNESDQPSSSGGSKSEGEKKSGEVVKSAASDLPEHVAYVLIGAGTASNACAKAIRANDPQAKILIIGEEDYPPYMRPPLSKALWLEEDHEKAKELKFNATWVGKYIDVFYGGSYVDVKDLSGCEQGGTAVLTGHRVVQLSPADKVVTLSSGDKIKYDKCLIATGGVPNNLPVFTEASDDLKKKISVFRKIPDYLDLDKMVSSNQSVLVVGGGFLGSELSVAMASRGRGHSFEVNQVFLEDGNLGLVLPKMLSDWTTEQVRNEGVKVFPNNTVQKVVLSEDGKVCATTKDGQELKVDHVLVAVGLRPEVSLASSASLELDSQLGGYRVNAELQACSDVWVAGDVSCFYDPYLGRRRVEHHDHANVSGKLAGENMTGAAKPFTHQSMFWSDVGPKVGFEAVGLINSSLPTVGVWAKDSKALKEGEEPKDDFSKGVVFYMKEDTIVGVLTWNIYGQMELAKKAISGRKMEKDIADLVKDFNLH